MGKALNRSGFLRNPGNNESGGKRRSGRTTKGNKWLRAILVECGHAAGRTTGTYLGSQYARLVWDRNMLVLRAAKGRSEQQSQWVTAFWKAPISSSETQCLTANRALTTLPNQQKAYHPPPYPSARKPGAQSRHSRIPSGSIMATTKVIF